MLLLPTMEAEISEEEEEVEEEEGRAEGKGEGGHLKINSPINQLRALGSNLFMSRGFHQSWRGRGPSSTPLPPRIARSVGPRVPADRVVV